jgi:hypothetical protein
MSLGWQYASSCFTAYLHSLFSVIFTYNSDPNKVSARSLMDLVCQIMERAVSSVIFALPAAKLCITIIEVRHM